MDTFIRALWIVSHNHKLPYYSDMYVKVKILWSSSKLLQNYLPFTTLCLKMELENTHEIALILNTVKEETCAKA